MKLQFLLGFLSLTFSLAHAELVGHWPLDTDANDTSGNGHDGAVVTGIGGIVSFGQTGAGPETGSSASFSDGGHIDVPFSAALNPESFTVTLWARHTDAEGGEAFRSPLTSRNTVGGNRGYLFYANSADSWSYWTGNGQTGFPAGWSIVNGTSTTQDEWVHLAITYDATSKTKRQYIDGNLEDTVTGDDIYEPILVSSPSNLHIGSGGDDGTEFIFTGDIDDVAVYNDALSLEEILSNIDNGAANALPDPRIRVNSAGQFAVELDVAGPIEVNVLNDGTSENLMFSSVEILAGGDSDHFSVGTLPGEVLPGENATLVIDFDPLSETGVFVGNFEIFTNDPINSIVNFTITATFTGRLLEANAPPSFSGLGVQSGSVTIVNTSTTTSVDLTNVAVVGVDSSFFTVDDSPTSLAAGASGQIDITFDPREEIGAFNSELLISSSETSVDLRVPLSGVIAVTAENSLVGWWPLDIDTNDVSGNNYNGIPNGSIVYGQIGASSVTGTAALFSGAEGIDIPHAIPLNSRSFTATIWVRPSLVGGNFRAPFSNRDDINLGENAHGWILYHDSDGFWDFWTGTGDIVGDEVLWDRLRGSQAIVNEWVHLAVSYDHATNTKTFYVDGVVASSSNATIFTPNRNDLNDEFTHENEDLHIGSGGDEGAEFRWQGLIDDVGLFRTALTQEQVAAVIANGVGGFNDLVTTDPVQILVSSATFDSSNAQFSLTWLPVGGATEYRIDRAIGGLDASAWEEIGVVMAPTITFTDLNLPVNELKVFYRVRLP